MTVASGSGCPWVDRQCPRCPEYRALRPNVGAQQKHSFVRPGASWATRPAIGRSICAAAYLLAKPSHDATDVIVDLPDPDLAPRGDPHPHRHRDPLGPALDSGKCISVDLGPAASHRDTFSMSISNTDSQVQRNPLRSISLLVKDPIYQGRQSMPWSECQCKPRRQGDREAKFVVWVERGLVHFVFLLQHLWLGRSMYG
ncbi:hypothetical protein KXV81_002912 [Aspergillus fumigatus]|nr:hypothetical protein KXX45_002729 [Aspergillus fumigatus]KAH1286426.1 hypothetical protein KXX30_009063 [Aspergillus fumigatus]KAH1308854.1 hypothetical protein KXX66_001307 [Aspergillus fumigatus]KAH1352429.1 hypothetical protein KXX63_002662 [Aspergillus fumigatus]KAH1377243.1 hypothetical protein KXX50_009397 [Aspergillus fumigatus]